MPSQSLKLARTLLGHEVDVTIDRPLGSVHPKHGFRYEVNYGYIDGLLAPDGEYLDAYVLGPDQPLTQARGVCVAIVHRSNDDDDKIIVVPSGYTFSNDEIASLVHFQEQWFHSRILRA